MKEILFRGQTRRKGEKVTIGGEPVPSNWVYGGVAQTIHGSCFSIIYQFEPKADKHTVYADTVGQYIGITDKNGSNIFEGDILKIDDEEEVYVIEYNDEEAAFEVTGQISCVCIDFISHLFGSDVEVIGNIHDNPELLEGGD